MKKELLTVLFCGLASTPAQAEDWTQMILDTALEQSFSFAPDGIDADAPGVSLDYKFSDDNPLRPFARLGVNYEADYAGAEPEGLRDPGIRSTLGYAFRAGVAYKF